MTQRRDDLERFLHPRAVVLVGGVDRNADPEALRKTNGERWGSRWHLVNPRGGSVGDIPIHQRVVDVPDDIDLAVISVGVKAVSSVIDDCAAKGIRNVVVYSSGYSELGAEGVALEAELSAQVRRLGIRMLGPNTNTNAFEPMPRVDRRRGGRVGLVTQSGNQGRPLVQAAFLGVELSRWVATGNEGDLDAADFIEYFAGDADTTVIAAYVEGFRDPDKLRRALAYADAEGKPVVCIKIGRTEAGAAMARSHTGHLAGSDAIVQGLFDQYGVVRVHDLDELMETAALLSLTPPAASRRVVIYGASGGSSALMAELAAQHGLDVAPLATPTQQALHEVLPTYLSVANPVDNGMKFLAGPEPARRQVLETIAADAAAEVIVTGINTTAGAFTENMVDDLCAFTATSTTPVVVVWSTPAYNADAFAKLVEAGIPLFRSNRGCMAALRARAGLAERAPRPPVEPAVAPPELDALLSDAHEVLDVAATGELLRLFGVPMVPDRVVTTAADAAAVAEELGFPVVMKVASPDIAHKSDAGLVRLGVATADAARSAYDELTARAAAAAPGARLDGVQVQPQLDSGVELIVGVVRDAVMGVGVMVGLGGIYAEVLKDTAVRPVPLTATDVEAMLSSLRAYGVLTGARGSKPVALGAVVEAVLAVSRLAEACGDRLLELDVNPLIAMPEAAYAVDGLVVLCPPSTC